MKDYYEILEVSRNASIEVIEKAYKALVMKYHPDRNSDKELAHMKMVELNEAYEVLSNLGKKKYYDELFNDQKFREHSNYEKKKNHAESESAESRTEHTHYNESTSKDDDIGNLIPELSLKNILFVHFVLGFFLFLSLFEWPYAFYSLLRWIVTIGAILLIGHAINHRDEKWRYIFGFIAFLFNPIVPVILYRGMWQFFDFVTLIIIVVSLTSIRDIFDSNSFESSIKKVVRILTASVVVVLLLTILLYTAPILLNGIQYAISSDEVDSLGSTVSLENSATEPLVSEIASSQTVENDDINQKSSITFSESIVETKDQISNESPKLEGDSEETGKKALIDEATSNNDIVINSSSVSQDNLERSIQEVSVPEMIELGDSKEKVKEVMGAPTAIYDALNTWGYNGDNVDFDKNDKVISWSNTSGNLKLYQYPIISDNYINIGTNKSEILNIMGTPTAIYDALNTWGYNGDNIDFDSNDEVISWSNGTGNLRIAEVKVNISGTFKLGSTKEDVLQVMGNPESIYDSMNTWGYGADTVDFSNNDIVIGWSNIFGKLRLERSSIISEEPIAIGMSKKDILSIMGTPDSIYSSMNTWSYEGDSIDFDSSDKVKSWSNIFGSLKLN